MSMNWLFNTAFADEVQTQAQAAVGQSTLASFVPLILIFLVFYFVLVRPQMKKQKEQESMIKSLQKGDKVVTAGGMVGTIHKVEEGENMFSLEIAPEVRIKIIATSVTEKLKS